MVKKLSVIVIIGVATMLLLISCSRSASQSPQVALSTPTGKINVTVQQPTGVGQIELIGTTQMLQTMTALLRANAGGANSQSHGQSPHLNSLWYAPTRDTAHRSGCHSASWHHTNHNCTHVHTRASFHIYSHAR